MASTLSGPNIEEEYMWSCTLSGSDKEYEWAPKEPQNDDTEDEEDGEDLDPSCKPNLRLLIKQAILHPEAKDGEVTMLQVETIGYNKQKIVAPIVAMKSGSDPQKYIDLLIPDAAKIKVISGSGPISLVGSHCVDFYDYRNYGAGQEDDDDEDEEEEDEDAAASSEDDAVDMEEQEAAAPPRWPRASPPRSRPRLRRPRRRVPARRKTRRRRPSRPRRPRPSRPRRPRPARRARRGVTKRRSSPSRPRAGRRTRKGRPAMRTARARRSAREVATSKRDTVYTRPVDCIRN